MPFVTGQLAREGTAPGTGRTTAEQKAAIVQGISQVLPDLFGKPHDRT